MFSKSQTILCSQCGLEVELTYPTVFKKWGRKIRYCPYCGWKSGERVDNSPIEIETNKENMK